MMRIVAATLFITVLFANTVVGYYPACSDGLTCRTLSPAATPELVFDCAWIIAKTNKSAIVYHMHGNDGRRAKAMFFGTMKDLALLGYTSLSCDARGYSPGASPKTMPSYSYNELIADIFGLVDAFATYRSMPIGGKFHVVAHDQGARVSWHAIAKGTGRSRFLTFTSLSIPHGDVFSDALFGNNTDLKQQESAQYVRMLVLPNSTTVDTAEIYHKVCVPGGWPEVVECQRTLWWYNGAIDSGAMALAPDMPYSGASKYVGIPRAVVQKLTQYPLVGVGQTAMVGNISEFPVLYACGTKDTSDLCEKKFGTQTCAKIKDCTYLQLPGCGHDVVGCTVTGDTLIDAIVANIGKVSDNA
jgi:pimeloyl-ACP methyl ester carboxylesterase